MKLIVGLGNPGRQYENTRHNIGFMFVDRLAGKLDDKWTLDKKNNSAIIKTQKFLLVKPQTFMNSSGEAVVRLVNYYKINPSNVYIVHDDLDIPLGQFKIDFAKGPKVHGGINSIVEQLDTEDFWRIRIGVDNRDPDNRIPGEEYVLQPFLKEEKEIIHKVLFKILSSEDFDL